ncbi:hypothetical protein [Bermanella sp. R86510]|uniref:hypothetical protein n=1 Tax=unclassified Bermanella TaxID=2627862 RepID=UPI0037CB1D7B
MSSPPSQAPDRPKFRIQQAILILRQGKSHPLWREAAWHLMDHAGKDTQLLLEAQRDLLSRDEPENPWPKRILFTLGVVVLTSLVTAVVWLLLNQATVFC